MPRTRKSTKKQEFFPPHNIGDVVVVKDGNGRPQYLDIITQVQINGVNEYEYAVTGSAWHDHNALILFGECSENSMKKVVQSIHGY